MKRSDTYREMRTIVALKEVMGFARAPILRATTEHGLWLFQETALSLSSRRSYRCKPFVLLPESAMAE